MKKMLLFIFALICLILLTACGGDISNVRIKACSSDLYSEAEISDAIETALRYFRKEFKGCTLAEIGYLGDERIRNYQEFAVRNKADDVIVLVSSFTVGASGGDGSLNPNSVYWDWKWILVRSDGGSWRHVDHGY